LDWIEAICRFELSSTHHIAPLIKPDRDDRIGRQNRHLDASSAVLIREYHDQHLGCGAKPMQKSNPDLTENQTSDPEKLVCNLATALVQHIDALDGMLSDALSEPLEAHLLHHLAYRAGYEGKGENFLELVRGSVDEGMHDATEGQDAKVTHQGTETRQ
jgi:hypothetical protein